MTEYSVTKIKEAAEKNIVYFLFCLDNKFISFIMLNVSNLLLFISVLSNPIFFIKRF